MLGAREEWYRGVERGQGICSLVACQVMSVGARRDQTSSVWSTGLTSLRLASHPPGRIRARDCSASTIVCHWWKRDERGGGGGGGGGGRASFAGKGCWGVLNRGNWVRCNVAIRGSHIVRGSCGSRVLADAALRLRRCTTVYQPEKAFAHSVPLTYLFPRMLVGQEVCPGGRGDGRKRGFK